MLRILLLCPEPFGVPDGLCPSCGQTQTHLPDAGRSYLWADNTNQMRVLYPGRTSVSAQEFAESMHAMSHPVSCSNCSSGAAVRVSLRLPPPLLVFHSQSTLTITPSQAVTLQVNDRHETWVLAGIVYFNFAHYTARYIDSTGRFWYHDGQSTRRMGPRPSPRRGRCRR